MPEYGQQAGTGRPTTVLIWDAEVEPPPGDWIVVLWRGIVGDFSPGSVSMPHLVEENADSLRKRYLSWIREFGEMRIGGQSLVERLESGSGFSYWWMTLLAEKCNYSKSPQIDHAIRLLALEDWASGLSISSVVLSTADARLAECLRLWCKELGLAFRRQKVVAKMKHRPWHVRLYKSLPYPGQALAWLILHLVRRWPLKGVGVDHWRGTGGRITFVSYLFNLDPVAASRGRFASRYWAHLPDALQQDACKTNWLHLYLQDELLPDAGKAADAINLFNRTAGGAQCHVTLDSFLTPGAVAGALRDWLRLMKIGSGLWPALLPPKAGMMDLWPLFRDDWRRSFSGQDGLSNHLNWRLFGAAMKSLPRQDVGVYLMENQGWEFALAHHWKAAGHGRLIGTPHSTVRFWDLRYFFDPLSYTGAGSLPMPDKFALNGPAAWRACANGGYPEERIVEVEALRYLHLESARADRGADAADVAHPLRVLVLGEYLPENTHRQMRLLERAVSELPPGTAILVKPHPACPVLASDYPGLAVDITMDNIALVLRKCDVAYTNNVTSAAVDAYYAGTPVVSMLDSDSLNMSPLRGHEDVAFVSSPKELACALQRAVSVPRSARKPHGFFNLDSELPRWRKLLAGSADSLSPTLTGS